MWSIEFQVMLGALVVLVLYHAVMFTRLAFRKHSVEPDRSLPVSVVICARNEARTLEGDHPGAHARNTRTSK